MTIRNAGGAELFSRTVPFVYERHSFGEHKKASMARVEVTTEGNEEKPDKAYLSLQKRLIEMPELNEIRQHDTAFRHFLKNEVATPWRPGIYLVPVGLVEAVDTRAQAWEVQRAALARKAAAEYSKQVQAMHAKLGPLYNPADYPSRDRFAATFWVSWRFVDFGVPALLQTVKAEVFAREQAKVEAEGRQAMALIQKHLRTTLLEVTAHVASLLEPKADGKFRALRSGSLDDLNAFLDTIRLRDVTGDKDLLTVCQRLKALGKGLDFEELKDDKALRAQTAVALNVAKTNLEALVVERVRGVRFREEV